MTTSPLSSLCLAQTFAELTTLKQIVTVPIRKPGRQEWVAVHPEEGNSLGPVATITLKDDATTYVVRPDLVSGLNRAEYVIAVLHATITTSGAVFLWPVRVATDRQDNWCSSMIEAVDAASRGWTRVAANMAAGHYDVHTPVAELAAPAWPDVPFDKLVEAALKNRLIDSADHPVLRRLRGDF